MECIFYDILSARAELSLSTITILILLYSRPPRQSRLLAMRYETTSCPMQNVSSSEVILFAYMLQYRHFTEILFFQR